MTVGLTGGSGTGKSCAAPIFEKYGFKIIDFDKLSRDVCQKGTPCLAELRDFFGDEIVSEDGELIRKKLGETVFSDREKLKALNRITHKYILAETKKIILNLTGCNILFDAPLLFEAKLDKQCDYVISVIAPPDERQRRICKRDKISPEIALKRIQSQKDDSFYIANSDYVIINDASLSEFENKVKKIAEDIIRKGKK